MSKYIQESKRVHTSMRFRSMISLIILTFLVMISFTQFSTFSTNIQTSKSIEIPSNQVIHESIEITSDSDFFSQGWPGNGSVSNPFLIEGLTISSDDDCIRIINTRSHFVIRNCSLSWMLDQYHGKGVYLRNVTHGFVELCTMSGLGVGIYDRNSTENRHHNNTILNTRDGIMIGFSNDTVVSNNSITVSHGDGINIYNSRVCSVLGNFVSGIFLTMSVNCTVGYNYGLMDGLTMFGDDITHWLHQIYYNYVGEKMLGYFRDASDSTIDGALYFQLILVNASRTIVSGGVFQNLWRGAQIINSADCTLSDIVSKKGRTQKFLAVEVTHLKI